MPERIKVVGGDYPLVVDLRHSFDNPGWVPLGWLISDGPPVIKKDPDGILLPDGRPTEYCPLELTCESIGQWLLWEALGCYELGRWADEALEPRPANDHDKHANRIVRFAYDVIDLLREAGQAGNIPHHAKTRHFSLFEAANELDRLSKLVLSVGNATTTEKDKADGEQTKPEESDKQKQPVAISPSGRVKLYERGEKPNVDGKEKDKLTSAQYDVVLALLKAGDNGLTKDDLDRESKHGDARKILYRLDEKPGWKNVIALAGETGKRYRIL